MVHSKSTYISLILLGFLSVAVTAQTTFSENTDLSQFDWLHYDGVEWAIFNEENINIMDSNGLTPLAYAAAYGDRAVLKAFQPFDPIVNLPTQEGWTPLTIAIIKENNDAVSFLIDEGADINGNSGNTPLATALNSGNILAATLLIENGVNIATELSQFGVYPHITHNLSSADTADLLVRSWGTYTQKLKLGELAVGRTYRLYDDNGIINVAPY
ncbi:MAG: ankyrin repeat domain-containing protein [Salinispira sp.]